MSTIKPCDYKDIAPYVEAAKKERIGITQNTHFYIAESEGGETVGFCGIVFMNNFAVIKNIYVLPEHRRYGIGEALIRYQIGVIRDAGYPFAKAYCTPASVNIFLKLGAEVVKEYKTSTVVKIDTRAE